MAVSDARKKFEALRNKIKQTTQEKSSGKTEKDYSWQFRPSLIENQGRTVYTVRILPKDNSGNVEEPWIDSRVHIFKPTGADRKTYQVCPTTFDEAAKCPICEASKVHFNKGDKANEDIGRGLWRKKRYFVNVLVKEDPRTGDDNQTGKVLVWEFGSKVFDKLKEAIELHGLFFWDIEDGFDFNVVIKKVSGYNNYDSSDFARVPSSLKDDDYDVDAIMGSLYDLPEKAFGVDENGKVRGARSYDELADIFQGKSVRDENTKDKRVGRTIDTGTSEETEKEETTESEDDPWATVGASEPEETETETETEVDEENDIDISSINFDADDPV